MTDTAVAEPVAFKPDKNGDVFVVDVGERRAIHVKERAIDRLTGAAADRLRPPQHWVATHRPEAA